MLLPRSCVLVCFSRPDKTMVAKGVRICQVFPNVEFRQTDRIRNADLSFHIRKAYCM